MFIIFPFLSRLKIEELEAERSKLEEENRSLEMKLEKLTLQVGNVEVQKEWLESLIHPYISNRLPN